MPLTDHPPFVDQPVLSPINAVAYRLTRNFFSDAPEVIGTATAVGTLVLVTARHVLDGVDVESDSIAAVQILPDRGAEYMVWDVELAWLSNDSDLALLRLNANPTRSGEGRFSFASLDLDRSLPNVGDHVAAFGFRQGVVKATRTASGGRHVDLNSLLTASVGVVRDVHPVRRDQRLPFPCFHIGARFDGGMSGGPVVSEAGKLIGVVCSGIEESPSDLEPVAYAASVGALLTLDVFGD